MSEQSFKTLKKKIEKVDAMLKELDSSDEKYKKLQSKREKYYEQLKQTPEWETEGPAIERRENLKRQARQLRETANRAEKVRKDKEHEREAEKEKKAKERDAKRLEKERLEKERLERERLEKLEKERLNRERKEQERLEREHEERERLENERLERAREERERLENERLEREREEQEREERERLENERLEREREERERLENERLEREREERERLEKERLEQEREEQELLEKEQLQREREEQETIELQRLERQRIEQERLEQDRLERENEEKRKEEKLQEEHLEQGLEKEALENENEEKVDVGAANDDANETSQLDTAVAANSNGEVDEPDSSSGLNDYPPDRNGGGPGDPADVKAFESTKKPKHTESSVNIEQAAPPRRPMLGGMGGMLAEIGQRKKQMDATRKPIVEKRAPALKLVDTKTVNAESADSQSADKKVLEPPKPQHADSTVNSEDAAPPRRPMLGGMGGMLAEIGQRKKQMDATRKPTVEKRAPALKLVETKTVNAESVNPSFSATVPKPSTETPQYTSRGTGEEKLSEDFLKSRKSTLDLARSENTETILRELSATEEYHEKLEKNLKRNGIPIPADIPYEVCKDKIASITKQMQNLQETEQNPYTLEKRYFDLEQELMKYSTAMMVTDEWAEDQQRLEQEWEDSVRADNIKALQLVRSHMPVNVRSMTEEALCSEPSPNGKVLPQAFARKFKRTNVLQLLRVNPLDIEKMHPSYFEGMRTTGLTLTERRALHEHTKGIGAKWLKLKADKNVERKWLWFDGLKAKFKEMQKAYDLHRDDPQNRHVKADRILDYRAEEYGFPTEALYESTGSEGNSESAAPVETIKETVTQAKPKKKADDAEMMTAIRDRLELKDTESEADKKLLRELYHAEKRTRLLEKSLKQAGIEIPEDDIPYAEAKAKVAELTGKIKAVAEKMMSTSDTKEAAMLEKDFGNLSSELTRYQNAMMESKEWAAEQLEKERQWEESVRGSNQNALKMIRRHMPVKIRDMSEDDLVKQTTPNGKVLPLQIARKFKRTNILLLLRMDPSSIEPMHPSSLESLRTTGLTLTERRALHEHLRDLGPRWKSLANDKMAERKWMWHESLRAKFKELVSAYEAHVEKYGPEGDPNMGNRCLVKADRAVDYSGNYGFPEDAEFKVDSVAKSNLLTMEDIKKRKQEEEGEEEEEPAKPGGFLGAIAGLRK